MSAEREHDELRKRIIKAIRTVQDPEVPVNLYDLGLIYDLRITDGGRVHVTMTLTTPNCPVAESLPGQVQRAVEGVEGVSEVAVELVWEPKWEPDMMSDAAKLELEFTGHTGPAHLRGGRFTPLTTGRRPSDRYRR